MKSKKYFDESTKLHLSAFTLLELIIVITILAILSTIAFVSYQNYMSDARDSVRVTDIKNIQNSLDIIHAKGLLYPEPDSAFSYTGISSPILKQWVIGKTVLSILWMSSNVKDPLTEDNYIYSIFWSGYYYQIATGRENIARLSNITPEAYANAPINMLVKGDYVFDPSLPSLITITGSINTSGGIFDPGVCFITDGGSNNLNSTSSTCIKKSNLSLKSYDSWLVWYWDMETLTGALLKDLSGNENNAIFSWTIIPTSTWGMIWKAYYLNNGFFEIPDYSNKGISISTQATFNFIAKGYNGSIFWKRAGSVIVDYIIYFWNNGTTGRYLTFHGTNETSAWFYATKTRDSFIINGWSSTYFDPNWNYYFWSIVFNNGLVSIYINGNKVITILDNTSTTIENPWYISTSTGTLQIGARLWTNRFYGIIDDVKIYNRALSDREIVQQAKIAGF